MVKAKKLVYEKLFNGLPKKDDIKLVEEELPPLKDGEFLVEAEYLSVDPYQRIYAPRLPLGSTVPAFQVAKVIESKHPQYSVGERVVSQLGWRTHTISDGKPDFMSIPFYKITDKDASLPLSAYIGILGMPGNTAYFGFLEKCNPKAGETVVVTGAAGAVGNLVGQIAKIKGCTVIGIAGSEEKGKWLVNELKFDHFINYKDSDFKAKLEKLTPKGVDCYFDNVGGEISSDIIDRMNVHGRISVCGSISGYNDTTRARAPVLQPAFVFNELRMEGFVVWRFSARWEEGIEQNKKWIKEGKLKFRETVTQGFDHTFDAFLGMLQGKNTGKAVVKV